MRDLLQHPVNIFYHFVVPKTQHLVTARLEESGAPFIRRCLEHMLTAVDFQYQPVFEAAEVSDERAYRILMAEFSARELTRAQAKPQFAFHVGLIAA